MLLLYCLMAVVAIGGWLRFLGRLSWNVLTWAIRGLAWTEVTYWRGTRGAKKAPRSAPPPVARHADREA